MAPSSIIKKLSATFLGALIAVFIITGPLATVTRAQDSGALLNVLVKKGILSNQEAEDLRVELQKESNEAAAANSSNKLGLSSGLTEFKLFGDVRARYEYRSGENGNIAGDDKMERDRFRYRLRFGFTGKIAAGWFFGARLETASSNRSTNVTAGDYALSPFGKNTSNTIYVGQAYVGYTNSDFTFTAGRMAVPFVTTSMVWDEDINVEGLSEQWNHSFGALSLFANLGQYVYVGVGTVNNFGNTPGIPNTYLFGNQVGARVKFAGNMSLQIAPTYYAYSNTGVGLGIISGNPNLATLRPQGLQVLEVPVELALPPLADGKLPARIFGDVAYNFDAKTRAMASAVPTYKNENLAWQLGAALGQTKNKGDWEIRGFYQATDAFALDTNLVDSDLFDSRTNMKGWTASASYVIAPGVTAKLTYANADRKNSALPTYGAGDIATLNLTKYQLLQTDLSIKF